MVVLLDSCDATSCMLGEDYDFFYYKNDSDQAANKIFLIDNYITARRAYGKMYVAAQTSWQGDASCTAPQVVHSGDIIALFVDMKKRRDFLISDWNRLETGFGDG